MADHVDPLGRTILEREDLGCHVIVEHRSSHGAQFALRRPNVAPPTSFRDSISVSKRTCRDCPASLEGSHGRRVRCEACAEVNKRRVTGLLQQRARAAKRARELGE